MRMFCCNSVAPPARPIPGLNIPSPSAPAAQKTPSPSSTPTTAPPISPAAPPTLQHQAPEQKSGGFMSRLFGRKEKKEANPAPGVL